MEELMNLGMFVLEIVCGCLFSWWYTPAGYHCPPRMLARDQRMWGGCGRLALDRP
jgi:hypothetical protein